MKADVRLALPVIAAWAVVVALLAPNDGAAASQLLGLTRSVAFVSFLVAMACFLSTRWHGLRGTKTSLWQAAVIALGLGALITLALCVSVLVQLPTHVDIKPWDKQAVHYPWFLQWAQDLRGGLSAASQSLPGVGGQLIPGLAIGDTGRVSETLQENMKTVSLTHITAVSGANCVIVTASIMILGAKCGFTRTWRVILAVIALILFVILVTPQASVVRAAVMSCVVLITLAMGRPGAGLPLLSFATMAMLVANPWWAIDFGFILSVAATGGLLLLARPLATSLARFMPQLVATLISIPLAAQLACQPVIILLQPQIPTYGVLANVVAAPAAPLATVTGLLACLLLPFVPILGMGLLWLAWMPAQWIGQTAVVVAALPNASLAWLAGAPGVVLAMAGSTAVCLALLSRKRFVRRIVGGALVATMVAWLVSTNVAGMVFSATIPPDWVIAACDVGQGDALLVRDGEHVMLIDTGRTKEPLEKCLHQLGIERIDVLILTHYDLDHAGGVTAVLGAVDRALVGVPQNAKEDLIVKNLAAGGAIVERGDKGDTGVLGRTNWGVLWPAPGNPTMQDGNPGSITVRVQSPEFSAVFLGDLGEDAQNALMRDAIVESVEIVKVAHHGSGDQSSSLYRKLDADIGIISVGRENGYGHPTANALALLAEAGTAVSRTDENGLLLVRASGGRLSVWTER